MGAEAVVGVDLGVDVASGGVVGRDEELDVGGVVSSAQQIGTSDIAEFVDGEVEAGEGEPGGEGGAAGAGEVVGVEVEAGQFEEQQPDDDECEREG